MAESIYDIIARFSFEVGRSDVPQATAELKKQADIIKTLETQAKVYQNALSIASKEDTALQQKLNAELTRINAARDVATQKMRTMVTGNKELQNAIKQELGLIQQLTDKLNDLRHSRERAKTVQDIRAINSELAKTQQQLQQLTTVGKQGGGILASLGLGSGGSVTRQIGQGLLYGLGIGGGFGLITRAVSGITQLIAESGQLAKELEGVEIAFNRLNRPDLLDQLRTQTKGTVSDLQLMQFAVQSKNYEIPLDRIAELFGFARQRARETGLSVDYLVNSLVLGIGRESPKILDNLGINVRKVREEFNRTGDYATAVFNIIEEQAPKGTTEIKTLADEMDRLNVIIQNQQAELGGLFNIIATKSGAFGLDLVTFIEKLVTLQAQIEDLPLFGENTSLARIREAVKSIEQLKNQEAQTNEAINNTFLQQFKQFQEEYNTADKDQHKKIRQEAKEHLDALLQMSGTFAFNNREILLRAYNQLPFAKEKVRLDEVTTQGLFTAGFDRETLSDLQGQIKLRRNILTVSDREEIERLDKIDDEITRQIRLIDGKVKKTRDATNAVASLTATLKKQIEELNKAIELSDMQGRQVTEDSIKRTLDIQRQAALKEIEIEKQSAQERGLLNPVTSALFNEKTRLTQDKFRSDEINSIADFHKKRIEQERNFRLQLAQLELQQLDDLIGIQGNTGADTWNLRLQRQGVQNEVERQLLSQKYIKLLEEAMEFGGDLDAINTRFEQEQILQQEQAQQRELADTEAHYREKLSIIESAYELINSTLEAALSEELSITDKQYDEDDIRLGKYLREQAQAKQQAHLKNLRDIKQRVREELEAAIQAQNELPAGASAQQINDAQSRVNRARVNVRDADRTSAMAGSPRSDLAVWLFGTDLIAENITKQEQWQLVIQKTTEAWTTLSTAAGSALSTIIQLQQASLDREIEIRKTRVQAAIELAERGNSEILKQEQDRLDSALRAREESARKQIVINAALQTSNALVAVAQAAATGPAAIVLIPAIIAAIISGYAAISAATQNTQTFPGFKKGGHTGKGNDDDVAGHVHKNEYVFTAKRTREIGLENLEALHNGYKVDTSGMKIDKGYANKQEMKEVVSELREVKEAISSIHFRAENNFDGSGVHQLIETNAKKERNRRL